MWRRNILQRISEYSKPKGTMNLEQDVLKEGSDKVEEQAQSPNRNLETYKKDFIKSTEDKEEYILYTLDRMREYVLSEFKNKKDKAVTDFEKIKQSPTETDLKNEVYNVSLPFTDFTRHIQDKLSNVLHTKQFFLNVTNDMISAVKMTDDETKVAKDNFNTVCNYKKRRENNLSCEDLYNEPLVKYLVNKTFKKSATDMYNLTSCFPANKYFSTQETIKIACIGGGPGSDLTGVLNYLLECGYNDFDCVIYDYNAENWGKVCLSPLTDIIKRQSLKVFRQAVNVSVRWQFVDMKKSSNPENPCPKAHVFSTCWALNECLFNEEFWIELIETNPQSFLFFVDGETYPIERFRSMKCLDSRKFVYEGLENPRRLAILPLK